MIKSKKGSFFLGFIIFLVLFISGVLFIPFLQDATTTTRIDLDCANTSISAGTMITCLEVDASIPYFIWLFVSIALGFIGGKLL